MDVRMKCRHARSLGRLPASLLPRGRYVEYEARDGTTTTTASGALPFLWLERAALVHTAFVLRRPWQSNGWDMTWDLIKQGAGTAHRSIPGQRTYCFAICRDMVLHAHSCMHARTCALWVLRLDLLWRCIGAMGRGAVLSSHVARGRPHTHATIRTTCPRLWARALCCRGAYAGGRLAAANMWLIGVIAIHGRGFEPQSGRSFRPVFEPSVRLRLGCSARVDRGKFMSEFCEERPNAVYVAWLCRRPSSSAF